MIEVLQEPFDKYRVIHNKEDERRVNITAQAERVLRVFLEDTGQSRYGYELIRRTELKSGTLLPDALPAESRRVH